MVSDSKVLSWTILLYGEMAMRRPVLGFLQISRVWRLYAEVVHHALFIELLRHEVPLTLVAVSGWASRFMDAHGMTVALAVIVLLNSLKRAEKEGGDPPKKPGKKVGEGGRRVGKAAVRSPTLRDKHGRFKKAGPEDRRGKARSKL